MLDRRHHRSVTHETEEANKISPELTACKELPGWQEPKHKEGI